MVETRRQEAGWGVPSPTAHEGAREKPDRADEQAPQGALKLERPFRDIPTQGRESAFVLQHQLATGLMLTSGRWYKLG